VSLTRYGDLLRCKSDRQRNRMHRWLNEFGAEKPRSSGACQNHESKQDERSLLILSRLIDSLAGANH
jgi:hypothetical protein